MKASSIKPFHLFVGLAAFLLSANGSLAQTSIEEFPYFPATHSHNDYYQDRPLLDALNSGMTGVEPDVFYVGIPFVDDQGNSRVMGELYVAHDWNEIEGTARGYRTIGTLTETYLDPLWKLYHERGGIIHSQGTLLLHVDMKTQTEITWRLLNSILQNYPGLVTRYDLESRTVIPGPVTVYTNAEPSAAALSEYAVINATADGRFGNIYDPSTWESAAYLDNQWRMPIVSSNLVSYNDINQFFNFLESREQIVADYADRYPGLSVANLNSRLAANAWRLANELVRDGKIEVADYLVSQMVEADRLGRTHGHLIRFWASPDQPWFWDIISPLEYVVIATDDPEGVKTYLETQQ